MVTAIVLRRRLTPPRGTDSDISGAVPAARHGEAPLPVASDSRRRAPGAPRWGGPDGLWRSAAVDAHVRLLIAAVPATAIGYLTATGAAPLGSLPAGLIGALAIALVFALLAKPLQLTELNAALSGVTRRLGKRPTKR